MSARKKRARGDVIAQFDRAVIVLEWYVDQIADSEERSRLAGQVPALRDARYKFIRATVAQERA